MAQQKVSDTLFEALDIIINKRIEAVQKDKTILCVVEDNSKAEEGEYIVSNASAKFTAYSENTKYRNGQNVWVLIPEGDYNNEKKIIGKHVGDSSTPYIYVDPMDSYANMTGNVLNGVMDFSENGLLANCSAPKNIFTGATIGTDRIPTDMTSAYTVDTTELDITGGFKSTVSLANYDRMGISAKFRTNFGSLDPLNGSYGLIFIIKTLVDVDTMTDAEATAYNNELNAELDLLQLEWVNTANITQEQADQMIADYIRHFNLRKENLAKAHKEERFITVVFDSKDMWGNPYGYNVPFTQTMCVDIDPAVNGTPVAITGFFYQNYDFINTSGVIPYYTPNQYGVDGEPVDSAGYTLLPANIFVQDINVSFGYAVDKVEDDTIFLFTQNNNTYRVNNSNYTKLLETRYIYVGDDNTRIAINSFADLNEYLAKSENLKNLAPMIRWYRYKLQEGIQDTRAGDFWEEFYPDYEATTGSSPRLTGGWFSKEVNDLISLQDERFKCILCYNPKFAYYIRSYILALSKEGKTNTLEYNYHMAIWTWWFRTVCGWTGTASSTNAEFNKAFPYNTDVQLALDNENRVTSDDIWEQWAASDERIVSQELVFTNQDNAYDSTRDLVQALRLTANDPSHGVFNIYESTFGANNNLINSNDEKIARRVKATFWSAVSENEELNEVERLAWYIPRHNTMIKAPQSGVDYQTYKRIELSADTYEPNKYYTKSGTTYSLSTGDFNADVTYYDRSNEKYINSVAAINALTDISNEERALFKERIKDYYIIIDDEVSSKADKTKEAILIYHIKPELKKHWTNNTIRASAYRYKRNYEGENAQFTPTFGVKGTNGTDYTLSLSMLQETDANEKIYYNPQAWTWGSSTATGSANTIRGTRTASMQLRVQLFDPDDKEIELKASQCKWSFLFPTNGKITKGTTTKSLWELKTSYAATSTATSVKSLTPVLMPGQWFTEYETNTVSQYEGAILKCEVTLQKDAFVGYLTIPMRKSRNYIGMEGPSIVRYEASGTGAKYYDAPYGILDIDENIIYNNSNGEENNVTLELMHTNDAKYLPVVSNLLNPLEENVAKQKPSKDGHYHLFPKAMHFNNVEYCAYVKIHDGNTTAFLWSQPLLILIDPYGNEFLNNWGGELNIDYDSNSIMSAVMGAGKKESDNSFTGLLLGDLPKVDGTNTKTGLLGYEHGEQAYGIFDDGTMFLGKSSRAQLKFNGTEGLIQNAGYDYGHGIKIDFDGGIGKQKVTSKATNNQNPYIDMIANDGSQVYISTIGSKTNPFFKIKSPTKELLHIGTDGYYLQTNDYQASTLTQNATTKNYTIKTAGVGGRIDLTTGELDFANFKLNSAFAGDTTEKYSDIEIRADGHPYLLIRQKDENNTTHNLIKIARDASTMESLSFVSGTANIRYNAAPNKGNIKDGITEADNSQITYAKSGFKLDLSNSKLLADNFELFSAKNSDIKNGFIRLSAVAKTYPFNINNAFYVDWNGAANATNLAITGGSISIGNNFSVSNAGVLTATGADIGGKITATSGSFNGEITATGGTIGGWNIGKSSLYNGNTYLYSNGTISGAAITGSTFTAGNLSITNNTITVGNASLTFNSTGNYLSCSGGLALGSGKGLVFFPSNGMASATLYFNGTGNAPLKVGTGSWGSSGGGTYVLATQEWVKNQGYSTGGISGASCTILVNGIKDSGTLYSNNRLKIVISNGIISSVTSTYSSSL